MPVPASIEERLKVAFPSRVVAGVIAPHECDECDALRGQLEGATWIEISSEFIRTHEGSLPLLSQEAYLAFLPAWLRHAVHEPEGEVAAMLLVNLSHEPQTEGFTPEQASTIVDVARFLVTVGYWGADDPVNAETLAAIEAAWAAGAPNPSFKRTPDGAA